MISAGCSEQSTAPDPIDQKTQAMPPKEILTVSLASDESSEVAGDEQAKPTLTDAPESNRKRPTQPAEFTEWLGVQSETVQKHIRTNNFFWGEVEGTLRKGVVNERGEFVTWPGSEELPQGDVRIDFPIFGAEIGKSF